MSEIEFTVAPSGEWLRVTQKAGVEVRVVDIVVEPDDNGKMRVRQLRVPDCGEPITPSYLRDLRLPAIEAHLDQLAQRVREGVDATNAAESTAASGGFLSVAEVARRVANGPTSRKRLERPVGRNLGDDFLQSVADTYRDALARGVAPTPFIAEQTGVPRTTAMGWVQAARGRGFLGKTQRGRAGV